MSESVSRRTNAMSIGADARQLRKLLDAALADNTALRATIAANVTDIAALATAVDTLAAKLNADAGVTDTDYSTGNAAAVTGSAPSALTLTE